MQCNRSVLIRALIVCVFGVQAHPGFSQPAVDKLAQSAKQADKDDQPVDTARLHNPVLWHDPGTISSLDLFYGQGGKDDQPAAPFSFESEDLHGTNAKFDVRDGRGTKWRVKLGDEARPEVVASRLLWAVGYFVNDDYLVESAQIQNLQLTRKADMASEGEVVDARFEKKLDGEKKIGIWAWNQNPFTGTKEFNGLRVMMAVMNNWDLKDENNAVFEGKDADKDIFLTSDIGASFGTNGLSYSKSRSKGDVGTFEKSKFITRKTDAEVDFATPAVPNPVLAPNVKQYEMRRDLKWIGKDVPIADVRWIASLLKQLSHQQLMDAFRAGHFRPEEIDRYVNVVEARVSELAAL
ncbi:MAG TPA: hypothetical protein VGI45_28515 [Terracidiphilus sp.]|jgi:hypothetical protein